MQLKVDGALKASDSNNVPSIGPPGTTTDLDQSFLISYKTIVATGGSTFVLSLVYDYVGDADPIKISPNSL